MGFWIWGFDDGDEEQIEAACAIAAAYFKEKGIEPEAAQQAAIDAADLPDSFDGPTPNADLVVAWYKAENEAFEHLAAITGHWPSSTGATLVYVQQGE